jgi:hypothetical protein
MSFRSAIASAVTFLEKELESPLNHEEGPPTFTWKGREVPCVPSTLTRGVVLTIGPGEYTIALVLYVLRSEFLTVDTTLVTVDSTLYTADNDKPTPVAKMHLTFRGQRYKILQAGEDPSRAYYTLTLGDANSGR